MPAQLEAFLPLRCHISTVSRLRPRAIDSQGYGWLSPLPASSDAFSILAPMHTRRDIVISISRSAAAVARRTSALGDRVATRLHRAEARARGISAAPRPPAATLADARTPHSRLMHG